MLLDNVCAILENDANLLAEKTEGKAGSNMAQLITKSNTLRRRYKEKLFKMDKIIEEKAMQLRQLNFKLNLLLLQLMKKS